MVDQKRVRRKLPSLLIDEPTTTPAAYTDYRRIDRHLTRMQRRNPQRTGSLLTRLTSVLEEIDRMMIQDTQDIAHRMNQMERTFYEPRKKK